jgi:hypothetical protein
VISRRALLGLVGLAAVGCSKHPTHHVVPPPVVPDAAALVAARRTEQLLLASYNAQIRAAPLHQRAPLQVARAIHVTHLAALHGRAAPADRSRPVTTHLLSALRTSATQLRGLALAATDGANAALLASIAASHETSAT